MRKASFTFVVANPKAGRIHKLHVPQSIVLTGGIFSIIFLIVSFLASLHYSSLNYRTRDYERIQTENSDLRSENRRFKATTTELEEKLVSLEVISQKLKKMSGMGDSASAGVGGLSSSMPSFIRTADRLTYLDSRVGDLQSEFTELNNFYQRQTMLMAVTPSILPVNGYESAAFGYRQDPFHGGREFHSGIDFSSPSGNKVVATADGVVTFAGSRPGYGRTVVVDHRFGMSTLFGHMSRVSVIPGQQVKRGSIVGYVGSTGRSTGPHLHYEVRLNDRPLNPVNFLHGRRG
ncbi:MAG TPA: M23 family metallopeptidase [Acidobacteriota bacterium]|jgi:murein DD-endopeptidase MepM/ murein hydrolase activator NlpD